MGRTKIIIIAGIALAVVLLLFAAIPGPRQLFDDPHSTVLLADDGQLLGARIANDGQWRFPEPDSIPTKYKEALLLFEDRYFYHHPGINPLSIMRALWQNLVAGKTKSGGSTITMQLVRLSRKGKPRVFREKIYEAIVAIKIELLSSKAEILNFYAGHAPFGGNVVGLDAASWRYFGRHSHDLSWAEATALAVLPNAPALVHPGRNRALFIEKRNRLLLRLHEAGKMGSLTYSLAILEPIPTKPLPLPDVAPHYLEQLRLSNQVSPVRSDLYYNWQQRTAMLMQRHQQVLLANRIHHAAVLVRDLNTGKVVVYQGNISCQHDPSQACHNDMVMALRSSGSILKPFLYAALLQEGAIQPQSLVPDVPIWIGGFSPRNFDEGYRGAVAADEALIRSLNIPFVLLLRTYGIEKFRLLLQQYGFTSFKQTASHYGLSLVLGGGEVSLWELTEGYRRMALPLMPDKTVRDDLIDAGASWLTLKALKQVNRPETESGWQYFGSPVEMAWKTGTSFGLRDAWAVGLTSTHVIGVWVGNADGTGRPGLTGIGVAAPLLFDVAKLIGPSSPWFAAPLDDLEYIELCETSGNLAGYSCPEKSLVLGHPKGKHGNVCNYHTLLRLNTALTEQIPASCFPDEVFTMKSWFVLPPLMERYYRRVNPTYKPTPPIRPGCLSLETSKMNFVYPPPGTSIYQPVNLRGELNPVVAEVVHADDKALIYWHLNGYFMGVTTGPLHRFELMPGAGSHELQVTDNHGNSNSSRFELILR